MHRLALASLLPAAALAHSHLAYIIINGSLFHGFDPVPGRAPGNAADRVGWSSSNTDDGFVGPVNYTAPAIACHLDGASTAAHAPVRAGDNIHVQWNGWPVGHPGPVLSYLAPCAGTADGCGSVDKTALAWTKIDDSSPVLIDPVGVGGGGPAGTWATNVLIANNNSWIVNVPVGLRPGPYVLRHEMIALHFAAKKGGAQNYPLCINLWVEPPADEGKVVVPLVLGGVRAAELYKEEDPGIWVDVFKTMTTYVVPGPAVAAGASPVPHSLQARSVPLRDGTPVRVTGTMTVPFVVKGTGARRRGASKECPSLTVLAVHHFLRVRPQQLFNLADAILNGQAPELRVVEFVLAVDTPFMTLDQWEGFMDFRRGPWVDAMLTAHTQLHFLPGDESCFFSGGGGNCQRNFYPLSTISRRKVAPIDEAEHRCAETLEIPRGGGLGDCCFETLYSGLTGYGGQAYDIFDLLFDWGSEEEVGLIPPPAAQVEEWVGPPPQIGLTGQLEYIDPEEWSTRGHRYVSYLNSDSESDLDQ
ncbi:glycosyl hydrolase family 61-domain-containing protein [Lasiosphaeris hirsuta]|uniref:lytic cellulose monooxygenase (C4-dehydrogenating) n=1 Tax=Lasiosphaeris hirsuta TaxID=260670 RepID=A0AA40A9Y4_9PEZI|nr:glycosyl hydrolase family 61-domain-containing protein [Lasiosphaeris hirsuta]